MKNVSRVYSAPAKHWVGDGFPVSSVFTYNQSYKNISPFLLLDYAAPFHFEPNLNRHPRGVGEHPHRGFETVTIAYQGEVTHKDSHGGGGTIKAGDIQWMTAGSGVMHEEFHSANFSRQGGTFEVVQLWVNLPAKDKMTAPRYQAITAAEIPIIPLADEAGQARIIAGEFAEKHINPNNGIAEKPSSCTKGIASTFTPLNLWDLQLNAGKTCILTIPHTHNLLLLVLQGHIIINHQEHAHQAQLVCFEQGEEDVTISTKEYSKVLLLSGEPIDEPVVGYGPFVMNSEEEIRQAFIDVQTGRFGRIKA